MTRQTSKLDPLLPAGVAADLDAETTLARGLPARVYYEPAIFEAESARLFPRTWVAAGVASDIPAPGDAIPVTVAGRNLVLLRAENGDVHGFYNACRHRGMKLLCQPARGVRSFVCPFHSWTYGVDGRLRAMPYVGGVGKHALDGFEKDSLGLIPVRVAVWCNTLFVNLDGKAQSFEDYVEPLVRHLGGARDWSALHHHAPGSIHAREVQGNWKEYVEISLEEYHLKSAHPQVFAGMDPLTWKDDPVIDRHLLGSEAQISGSYGAGYRYYSGVPLPRWLERGERWQSYILLFPNLGIFATSDQLSIEFVLPSSATHYDHRQEFYFDPSVQPDGVHKGAIDAAMQAWDLLNQQDAALLKGLCETQRTNDAIGNRSRFAGRWEVNVHRFQQLYLESLQGGASSTDPEPAGAGPR
jgi:choline monooxygenase